MITLLRTDDLASEVLITPAIEKRMEEVLEKQRENHRRNYRRHREKILERCRCYYRAHPEISRSAHHRHRALLLGAVGNFTVKEFRLKCEAFENKCVYCGLELPLVSDHAVPLSRGGSNSIDNIVPACKSCNSIKHTMTYDEFVERIKGGQCYRE